MKDLYTFDLDAHHALDTYKMVQGAYEKIFQRIGIPFVVVSLFRLKISRPSKRSWLTPSLSPLPVLKGRG